MVVPVAPQVATPNSVLLDQPRGCTGDTTPYGLGNPSSVTTILGNCSTFHKHPLLDGIHVVERLVADYRSKARSFFHAVIMSLYECPSCGKKLEMTQMTRTRCRGCGQEIDPTVVFQRSPCCNATLRLVVSHYSCSRCHQRVPSRFLFDEQIFNAEYFKEKMQESRERKALKREAMLQRLAMAHSEELDLLDLMDPVLRPDLLADLDAYTQSKDGQINQTGDSNLFNLEAYRQVILSTLKHQSITFDRFPIVDTDERLDRIRRFIVLIQMEHFGEVWLEQHGDQIWVMEYETHYEG